MKENLKLFALMVLIATIFASILYFIMGQNLIAPSGQIKFWSFVINGRESSQHITDWYTLSHIIHGVLFYAIYKYFFPKLNVFQLLTLSLFTEGAWEIIENTDFVINRYRDVTIGSEYFGDSVLNSFCDIIYCAIGFFIARKLPIYTTIAFVVVAELFVGYMIRDNLTLNIIMLLYPLDFIKVWQMGL